MFTLSWFIFINHFFSWRCGGNSRLPSITKDSPLKLEPELAWFHGFRGKTLEGLFEPLVYFSNGTGDLFFSTLLLSLHCRAHSKSEQTGTAISQDCFSWNHYSKIEQIMLKLWNYQSHLFWPNYVMHASSMSYAGNKFCSTTPAKLNSQKSGTQCEILATLISPFTHI